MTTCYYTAAAVRELERVAIEELHVPGFTLMQRAGRATFNAIRAQWPQTRQLIVCCGNGDNGAVLGASVKADLTVTFIGRKTGLIVGDGPGMCGSVVFDDLGVPPEIYKSIEPAITRQ